MRVLLAHKFHHITGGAEVFYFEVGRVLEEYGHDVAYFSTQHEDNVSGKRLYAVENPDYKSEGLLAKASAFSKVIYSSVNRAKMIEAIKDFKPDIIHAFAVHVQLTPSVLEAANIMGVPVVMSCNDYKHICPNYKLYDGRQICEACKGGKFYNAAIKKCCHDSVAYSVASTIEAYVHAGKNVYEKYVDKYLFASEFMLNKTREFWSDNNFNAGLLKNPFDAKKYNPSYGGSYGLYFGRIIEEKGVDRLVRAASKTDVPIKVVGDGPGFEGVVELAQELGAQNVDFVGALWGEELNDVLKKAAFVVVPSIWHENFPYVIFQAFAFGKPVLGSSRGGIPELVGDSERGLTFDPDDEAQLIAGLVNIFSDPKKTECMGKAAREYVIREFGDDVFYEKLMSHYRSVLS